MAKTGKWSCPKCGETHRAPDEKTTDIYCFTCQRFFPAFPKPSEQAKYTVYADFAQEYPPGPEDAFIASGKKKFSLKKILGTGPVVIGSPKKDQRRP